MSDDLTRAIAEALADPRLEFEDREKDAQVIAAALTPLIEARVREARAEALESEADRMEAHARRQIALPSNGNKARQKARDKQRGHNAGAVLTAARELRKMAEGIRNG